jgi:hypothetical protein
MAPVHIGHVVPLESLSDARYGWECRDILRAAAMILSKLDDTSSRRSGGIAASARFSKRVSPGRAQ